MSINSRHIAPFTYIHMQVTRAGTDLQVFCTEKIQMSIVLCPTVTYRSVLLVYK